jgi:hypothetical protein
VVVDVFDSLPPPPPHANRKVRPIAGIKLTAFIVIVFYDYY